MTRTNTQPSNHITQANLFLEFLDNPPDGKHFRLTKDFECHIIVRSAKSGRQFQKEITVPAGTATDFASIPPLFRVFLPRVGRYGKATVIHDYYCDQCISEQYPSNKRKRADKLFRDAMENLDVPGFQRKLMFWAVRIWGQLSEWKFKHSDLIDRFSLILMNKTMKTASGLLVSVLAICEFIKNYLTSF